MGKLSYVAAHFRSASCAKLPLETAFRALRPKNGESLYGILSL